MLILTNDADFDAVYDIMEKSFPEDERRSREGQRALLSRDIYRLYVAKEGGAVVGFVAVWMISTPFIEHFAVAESRRNCGLGGRLIDEAVALLGGACLEAEPPETELAARRVGFYQRHGFALNAFPYEQPPLERGKNAVRLQIMTHGKALSLQEFTALSQEIKKSVYF